MRQTLALCFHEIKRVYKQPRSWVLMFLMPILFTFIFGSLSTGGADKIPLALVDLDQSLQSQELARQLSARDMLDMRTMTEEEADAALRDKKVAGIVQIPVGYEEALASGRKAEVTFRHGPDLAIAPTIRLTVEDALAQAAVQIKAAQTWSRLSGGADWRAKYEGLAAQSREPRILVEEQPVTRDGAVQKMSNQSARAVGFSIMFVMMGLLFVTGTILEARQTGIWYRLLAAPATRLQVLGGYLLAFFLIGWIQFAILMGLSSLLFGVQWGDWLGQIVLISALLLCVVGLGLLLAGLVKTPEQQGALGSIVIVSTCMLGGVYWPLDIVSETMRQIANFVPQTWAMEGFTELVARGGTAGDILMPVGVLLAFAVVFLFVGVMRVKYE
jgi:ABC-2 type transport system permease protein